MATTPFAPFEELPDGLSLHLQSAEPCHLYYFDYKGTGYQIIRTYTDAMPYILSAQITLDNYQRITTVEYFNRKESGSKTDAEALIHGLRRGITLFGMMSNRLEKAKPAIQKLLAAMHLDLQQALLVKPAKSISTQSHPRSNQLSMF
tara:strand:- start:319 stop:759 length:441 start_codon:yes stop_codon:yes gene_type:complete